MDRVVKYCGSPERCNLKKCANRGCILDVPSTLDEMIKRYYLSMKELGLSHPIPGFVFIEQKKPFTNSVYVYHKFKKLVNENNEIKCHYCGVVHSSITIDHVIPKSKGGRRTSDNVVPACLQCNRLKADMDYFDFLEFMVENNIQISEERLIELNIKRPVTKNNKSV